jgi:hypothetical protein
MVIGSMAHAWLRGTAAGTAALTLLRRPGLARRLPERLPPSELVQKQAVRWAERRARGGAHLGEPARASASAIAHVAYGMSMGALYGALDEAMRRGACSRRPARRRKRRRYAAARGALWELAVLAAGYEGWMPAAGVRPAAGELRATERPLSIANPLVYGVCTALVYAALRHRAPPRRSP